MSTPDSGGSDPRNRLADAADAGNDVALAIDRYVRAKSKAPDDSSGRGYYATSAGGILARWYAWLADKHVDEFDILGGDRGPIMMRRYAQYLARRVSGGGISASTAETYYNVVSACLTYAVRDGELARNPALTNRAREPLPDANADRADQQFWDEESAAALLEFVDDRAHDAIDEKGSDAVAEARDRALVYVLAYSGVRGAEVVRATTDGREGRQGLRWRNVDTDDWQTMRVLGKSQEWETVPILRPARPALKRWYRIADPPSDEWPVFPTGHAPSKYAAVRDELVPDLGEDAVDDLLAERDVDELLVEHDLTPPAITTEGARRLIERLCESAGVAIDGNALKPHGARRGLGDTLFRNDRGVAQDVLRHRSLSTTRQAYQHIEAEETAERASDLLDVEPDT
ncbi:tyrosine-type recombinase/integrase [Haloferax sulfurifontis]|uniref:Site-specific recombinase XerD n=2 Tax=Haloferax sulfurifontis TaxID=255616 RepID=M0IIK2_9EURY|nr:tyrosine-type recombinase/integrase [Haloferax sulfurifontis]ELZ96575.1 site-specific recombinase XerD [Haloferax sulfurifontis ATCC BAA-897]GGC72731.1 hypothetical protein GCM10007209_38390 [Haloferax sulfurifontis]